MSNINKQALTEEVIIQAFKGTNFGRDDLKNILAETVIDAAAGWRCGYTATTICTQLGLLTAKGRASALGFKFISEHVQRETKRLKDELKAAEKRVAELEAQEVRGVTLPDYSKFYGRPFAMEIERQVTLALNGVGVRVHMRGED